MHILQGCRRFSWPVGAARSFANTQRHKDTNTQIQEERQVWQTVRLHYPDGGRCAIHRQVNELALNSGDRLQDFSKYKTKRSKCKSCIHAIDSMHNPQYSPSVNLGATSYDQFTLRIWIFDRQTPFVAKSCRNTSPLKRIYLSRDDIIEEKLQLEKRCCQLYFLVLKVWYL